MTDEVNLIQVREGDQWKTIIPHMAEAAIKDGEGNTITLAYISKAGGESPQVISGTGGLQIVGGLDIGRTLSVAGETTLGDQMEVAGMTVEMDGTKTLLSNPNGVQVSGHDLNRAMTTNEDQTVPGKKTYTAGLFTEMNGPTAYFKSTTGGFGKILYQSSSMPDYSEIVSFNSAGELRLKTAPTREFHSSSVVTRGYVEATDGTNNLLHTTGNEPASGFKRMNPCTYAGAIASRESDHYTVIATFGTSTSTKYFPISYTSRYGGFNGFGQIIIGDGGALNFNIRAIVFGYISEYVTLKATWVTIGSDTYVALLAKRNTGANMSLGLNIPFIAVSTALTAPINTLTDEQRRFTPTDTDTLYDVVIRRAVMDQ